MTYFAIGISGGTGSGKSTLASSLATTMPQATLAIPEDAYYLDQSHLPMAARAQVNFDHPDSLELDLLSRHLEELRAGSPIELPVYDFGTHSRTAETTLLHPAPITILEGILVLGHPEIRQSLDFKVFVDTPESVRLDRRIQRDTLERGRHETSVREQFARTAQPMHARFVEPSRKHADLVVSGLEPVEAMVHEVLAAVAPRL